MSPNTTYTMNADAYIWTSDGGQSSLAMSNDGATSFSKAITTSSWNQLAGYQTIQFTRRSTCTSAQVSISGNDPNTGVFVDNVSVRALTE
jgi:hypothetical protein